MSARPGPYKEMHGAIEARYQDDGLDEIVARNARIHIERMSDDWFWIGIEDDSGHMIHVHIGSASGRAYVKATIAISERVPPPKVAP